MRLRGSLVVVLVAFALVAPSLQARAAPGALDRSFGGDGRVKDDLTRGFDGATGVAIQQDGKIVAVGFRNGYATFGLTRYRPDGTRDPSFGGDGMVTTNLAPGSERATDLAIQADGRIVVVGSIHGNRFALARYTTGGALDPSFGGDGSITIPNFRGEGLGLVIQNDGKIVAAGYTREKFALARYSADGTLDPSFGGNGLVTTNFTPREDGASGVGLDPDGKIVAVGFASNRKFTSSFAVARYRRNGTLDASFGDHGKVRTVFGRSLVSAAAVAIQGNGRIVAAGVAQVRGGDLGFALARYRSV